MLTKIPTAIMVPAALKTPKMLKRHFYHKKEKAGVKWRNPSPNIFSITYSNQVVNIWLCITSKFCVINKNILVTLFKIHIAKPENVCYNIDTKEREVHSNEKINLKAFTKDKRSSESITEL